MASFDYGFDGEELNTSNRHFDDNDVVVENYSGYGSYSSFADGEHPTSGGFPDDVVEVNVDHSDASSPAVFGFEDPNPNYHESSPFHSIPVENGNGNGNGNGYGFGVGANGIDDGIFASDGPVLPPPGEMEPDEGFALREWRR